MEDAGTVEGLAVRPDGQPIASASVLLATFGSRAMPAATSTTEGDGHYRITDVRPGHYSIRIITPDHCSLTGRVTVRPASTVRLDFVLPA